MRAQIVKKLGIRVNLNVTKNIGICGELFVVIRLFAANINLFW